MGFRVLGFYGFRVSFTSEAFAGEAQPGRSHCATPPPQDRPEIKHFRVIILKPSRHPSRGFGITDEGSYLQRGQAASKWEL